jgi:hypothetical protein
MAVGIANFQTLFQTYYPDTDLPYLIPDNLPLLNMIPKEDGLSGDIIDHPFLYGARQGYSIDFNSAAAQAGTAPRAVRAALRCAQAYDIVEFFDKDMALSQGEAAYADMFQKTMTGAMKDFLNNLDLDLHASGTGWRGTVVAAAGGTNPFNGATLAANQIAVATGMALEAVFNQDQLLQSATYVGYPLTGSIFPPSDGRAPTTLSPASQVLAVDPVGRTLTLTDPSQFTVGTFIVQQGGAVGFSASNIEGSFIGLDAWVPYGGVSTTDNFCGVNRSVYSTRLAGYSFDGSRLSVEDALKRMSAKMSQGGARNANVCLINPLDWDALDSKMASFARYSTFDTATYGFDSIVISGAAGRIDVVADPHQPQGYARLITPDTWVLRHKMQVPHVVEIQGRTVEQGLNFDGRSARLRVYAQLCCYEPHKNGIVKLPQVLV